MYKPLSGNPFLMYINIQFGMPVLQHLCDPRVLQFKLYEFFKKFQYVTYLVMW